MTEEKLTKHAEKWLLEWAQADVESRGVWLRRMPWDSVSYPRWRAEALDHGKPVAFGEATDAWSAMDVLAVELVAKGAKA